MDRYYEEEHRPSQAMTILESLKTCVVKSGDWGGRASRSEFWHFLWINILLSWAFILVCIPYWIIVAILESIVDIQLLSTIIFQPLSYLPLLVFYSVFSPP